MNDFNFSKIGYLNGSSKIAKGKKIGIGTYGIYFAPYKLSGYNTCAKATKECIMGCLNTSGRVKMDIKNQIVTARINRTIGFYEQREKFMAQLLNEIKLAKGRAKRSRLKFAVRLNCTSDLSPEIFKAYGQNVMQLFPDVQFYDYTKIANRIRLTEKYPNYHLTFSYTGENWSECEMFLQNNSNVAIVFDVKKGHALPETFNGYKVIDGDISDYRPLDEKGCIVGLRWKVIANKANNEEIRGSKFVVHTSGLQHVTLSHNVQTVTA